MAIIKYPTIPSPGRWQADSSVKYAIRRQDIILHRIDKLVELYHDSKTTPAQRSLVLCDLFLVINFWVKSCNNQNKSVEKARYGAMMDLFEGVVHQLKRVFEVDSAVAVSTAMKEIFGLGMGIDGCTTDRNQKMEPFSEDQLRQYRVWFKDGVAYQLPWWENSSSLKKQLANSKHGYTSMKRGHGGKGESMDYSGFVMTLDRELYMTKQEIVEHRFHSSYNGGTRLLISGTILIKNGQVRAIRTDSGHYRPDTHNVYTFLWALVMYQVKLSSIEIYDYEGNFKGKADQILASPNKWHKFLDGRDEERNKAAERARDHNWDRAIVDPNLVLMGERPRGNDDTYNA